MMFQEDYYPYLLTKTFQSARLPYKDDFCMVVFLPHPEVSLAEMLTTLNPEHWESQRENFRRVNGYIGLPHFRFDYSVGLQEMLTDMGMGLAFESGRADFSRISPEFFLRELQHKVFVEVTEEGTSAAAVTLGPSGGFGVSAPPPECFSLLLDRPFCCAIEDERTGALLFLGVVLDPSQA